VPVLAEFQIYRSKQNSTHFVAVHTESDHANAKGVRKSENLTIHTLIPDDGQSRIAFDAERAKSRILRDGFYAFAVNVEVREHFE